MNSNKIHSYYYIHSCQQPDCYSENKSSTFFSLIAARSSNSQTPLLPPKFFENMANDNKPLIGFTFAESEKKSAKSIKSPAAPSNPISDVLIENDLDSKTISVHQITVNGLKNTRHSVVSKVIKPSLSSTSLPELFNETRNAAGTLKHLDIAKSVHVSIEKAKAPETGKGTPVNVILSCIENKRIMIQTGTEVTSGEISGKSVQTGSHELSVSSAWRQISELSKTASPSIREEAGNSLKNSASYTFLYNTLDDTKPLQSGLRFKLFNEISSLGGNSLFNKLQVEEKAELQFCNKFSIVSVVRFGALFPLLDHSTKSHISDRFFLGGPMSIRGFSYRGLGPFDGKDCLGGELMGVASLSLMSRLPFVKSENLLGQIFVNAGSLSNWISGTSYVDHAKLAFSRPCVSAGVGISYKLGGFNVEANYCVPLIVTSTDKVDTGFKFGLGINF
ncbi:SAM50-like protein [Smittium culicis]|uniref:SAM50-like protein n=1 Tax=Smittium culicis TaxID=133412 RepID=A0A1R1X3J6_9FUNG|nr:SAM50-like protein [Smittium culicis]